MGKHAREFFVVRRKRRTMGCVLRTAAILWHWPVRQSDVAELGAAVWQGGRRLAWIVIPKNSLAACYALVRREFCKVLPGTRC